MRHVAPIPIESSLERVNRLHLNFLTKNFEIVKFQVALVQTGSTGIIPG
jgi:hypothetical protein